MKLRKLLRSGAAVAACAMFISVAQAQDKSPQPPTNLVAAWDYAALYTQGLSAQYLIGTAVYDKSLGEAIGEVANLVVGTGGAITEMIIDIGGILGFGETYILFPFDQARIVDADQVWINIPAEGLEQYSLFPVVGGEPIEGRKWRITELLDDYAVLGNKVGYGYVEDVVINQQGQILAVVVQPDVTYGYGGYYAWPWYGYAYGFDPGLTYYSVPYTEGEVAQLGPFNYGELTGVPAGKAGKGGGDSTAANQ